MKCVTSPLPEQNRDSVMFARFINIIERISWNNCAGLNFREIKYISFQRVPRLISEVEMFRTARGHCSRSASCGTLLKRTIKLNSHTTDQERVGH